MANSDFVQSPYAKWLVGVVRSEVRFARLSAPEICTLFVPLGESPRRADEVFNNAWRWLESEVRSGRLQAQIGDMGRVEVSNDLATLRALEAGECGFDWPPPVPTCAVWAVPLWKMGPYQLPAHRIEFARVRVGAAVRHASHGIQVGERAPLRDWIDLPPVSSPAPASDALGLNIAFAKEIAAFKERCESPGFSSLAQAAREAHKLWESKTRNETQEVERELRTKLQGVLIGAFATTEGSVRNAWTRAKERHSARVRYN